MKSKANINTLYKCQQSLENKSLIENRTINVYEIQKTIECFLLFCLFIHFHPSIHNPIYVMQNIFNSTHHKTKVTLFGY